MENAANAYLLEEIGADTAENVGHKMAPSGGLAPPFFTARAHKTEPRNRIPSFFTFRKKRVHFLSNEHVIQLPGVLQAALTLFEIMHSLPLASLDKLQQHVVRARPHQYLQTSVLFSEEYMLQLEGND